jgi:hypothetical protein
MHLQDFFKGALKQTPAAAKGLKIDISDLALLLGDKSPKIVLDHAQINTYDELMVYEGNDWEKLETQFNWKVVNHTTCENGHNSQLEEQLLSISLNVEGTLDRSIGKWLAGTNERKMCSECDSKKLQRKRTVRTLPPALFILASPDSKHFEFPEALELGQFMSTPSTDKMNLAAIICMGTQTRSYYAVVRK